MLLRILLMTLIAWGLTVKASIGLAASNSKPDEDQRALADLVWLSNVPPDSYRDFLTLPSSVITAMKDMLAKQSEANAEISHCRAYVGVYGDPLDREIRELSGEAEKLRNVRVPQEVWHDIQEREASLRARVNTAKLKGMELEAERFKTGKRNSTSQADCWNYRTEYSRGIYLQFHTHPDDGAPRPSDRDSSNQSVNQIGGVVHKDGSALYFSSPKSEGGQFRAEDLLQGVRLWCLASQPQATGHAAQNAEDECNAAYMWMVNRKVLYKSDDYKVWRFVNPNAMIAQYFSPTQTYEVGKLSARQIAFLQAALKFDGIYQGSIDGIKLDAIEDYKKLAGDKSPTGEFANNTVANILRAPAAGESTSLQYVLRGRLANGVPVGYFFGMSMGTAVMAPCESSERETDAKIKCKPQDGTVDIEEVVFDLDGSMLAWYSGTGDAHSETRELTNPRRAVKHNRNFSYEGEVNAQRKPDGYGIYTRGDYRYVGHFSSDKFDGTGTLYLLGGKFNGFRVEGVWSQDKCRSGTLVSPSGRRYLGRASNGPVCEFSE